LETGTIAIGALSLGGKGRVVALQPKSMPLSMPWVTHSYSSRRCQVHDIKQAEPLVAQIQPGALLLFVGQPLFARMALPLLGGAPSVWNVALVF
jgi:hypothetical protein